MNFIEELFKSFRRLFRTGLSGRGITRWHAGLALLTIVSLSVFSFITTWAGFSDYLDSVNDSSTLSPPAFLAALGVQVGLFLFSAYFWDKWRSSDYIRSLGVLFCTCLILIASAVFSFRSLYIDVYKSDSVKSLLQQTASVEASGTYSDLKNLVTESIRESAYGSDGVITQISNNLRAIKDSFYEFRNSSDYDLSESAFSSQANASNIEKRQFQNEISLIDRNIDLQSSRLENYRNQISDLENEVLEKTIEEKRNRLLADQEEKGTAPRYDEQGNTIGTGDPSCRTRCLAAKDRANALASEIEEVMTTKDLLEEKSSQAQLNIGKENSKKLAILKKISEIDREIEIINSKKSDLEVTMSGDVNTIWSRFISLESRFLSDPSFSNLEEIIKLCSSLSSIDELKDLADCNFFSDKASKFRELGIVSESCGIEYNTNGKEVNGVEIGSAIEDVERCYNSAGYMLDDEAHADLVKEISDLKNVTSDEVGLFEVAVFSLEGGESETWFLASVAVGVDFFVLLISGIIRRGHHQTPLSHEENARSHVAEVLDNWALANSVNIDGEQSTALEELRNCFDFSARALKKDSCATVLRSSDVSRLRFMGVVSVLESAGWAKILDGNKVLQIDEPLVGLTKDGLYMIDEKLAELYRAKADV